MTSRPAPKVGPKTVPGKTPVADETPDSRTWERILGGIPLKTLEGFCGRMATGLRSGVDLLRLLDMETRVGAQRHREVMANLILQLRNGNTLVMP